MGTALVDRYAVLDDLMLTQVDENGVVWVLEDLKGWGSPGGSLSPVKRPRGPGTWSGRSELNGRSMVFIGTTQAPSPELAIAALDRLVDAASLDATPITVIEAGLARHTSARRDGDVIATWINNQTFSWSVQMHADDPRKFGEPITQSTLLPSTVGGLAVPFTVPFSINASTASGQVSIFNPGNATGPVALRIDGPIRGPIITHTGQGASQMWASSWQGGAGEFLTVDMETRRVLANGLMNSSRSNTVTSRNWFGLDRGLNTFLFTAVTFDPSARLTVTAIPVWE